MKLMQSAQTSNVRDSLSYICKYYGVRPDLVQAGGGNISIKDGDNLYIKSSGCTLFDVEPDKNISVVDLKKIREFNCSTHPSDISEKSFLQSVTLLGSQPSIETFFHAKTLKYTIHLHPVAVVQALNRYKNDLRLRYSTSADFVNYYRPGLELSDHISDRIIGRSKIIFLDNHGLIVHSDSIDEAYNMIEDVVSYCSKLVKFDIAAYKELSSIQDSIFQKYNEICYVIKTNADIFNDVRKTPDCVVYSGGSWYCLEDNTPSFPICVAPFIYSDHHFIVSKSFLRCKQIEEVLLMNSIITSELSINNTLKLLDWDSEKYRQKEV